MTYTVKTQDVDGASERTYKTAAAALKRFEEMLGYPIANAIWDMYYSEERDAANDYPHWTTLRYVRAVSNYGCVVSIKRLDADVEDERSEECSNPTLGA